jgi:hypothetical protein
MKKSKISAAVIFVFYILTGAAFSQGLGVNISLPERGGTFIDMVKEVHRWVNPSTWQTLPDEDFDEQGWPACDALLVNDLRLVAEWSSEIDDPEEYRHDYSGSYSCSFTGQATVLSQGEGTIKDAHYDAATNRTSFTFYVSGPPSAGHGTFFIAFTNTRRIPGDSNGSGFTNLKMIRPDYSADTQQTFTDDLINALTHPHFAAIRFMPFTDVNGADPIYPDVTEWSQRKLPNDAAQVRIDAIGKLDGASWEYVIELANLVHTDPWINVPVSATTDYVIQLATMFKEQLAPDLNIYIESSNEVWNTAPGFEQSLYNQAQAKALKIGEHENHARRTVELAQLFEQVFGTGSLNNRIRVILCSHAPMLKWWVEPMLTFLKNNFGEPNQFIYAIACQTYYGGGADAGKNVDKVLADCRASITSQINETGGNQAGRKQWIAAAQKWGFIGGFCSYEGGPDHGGGSTTNLSNRILAERSASMGEVLKYNYDDAFFQLGGNLAMQFTLSSAYTRYGCWGLTDDISDPDRNSKFQAARELIVKTSVRTHTSPTEFQLLPNFPNPFNPVTTLRFSLAAPAQLTLKIYNLQGYVVKTLANDYRPAGEFSLLWNGRDDNGRVLPSGLYFCRMQAGGFSEIVKLSLVK